MQLHAARLCLDCQEIHAESTCPVCTSESFAALSRWIPPQERRAAPRSNQGADNAETYRRLLASNEVSAAPSRWPTRLAVVVAAAGVGGWLWRHSSRSPKPERESKPSLAE